ncbi:RING finger protein 214-like isoform X1 [Acipenser ruthenus]|uniref:RING finger protein 214-like isoform X1 n=2 Tax=Acipenser ruthenus TaxID=7906 RepID=UPI0027419D8F|nr:RING finger protein 214-like isoform X1 [Acipenser ruthenus]XP_058866109.1 RING finger protein 214-like isoform X1 [Acipenser ruthenus]
MASGEWESVPPSDEEPASTLHSQLDRELTQMAISENALSVAGDLPDTPCPVPFHHQAEKEASTVWGGEGRFTGHIQALTGWELEMAEEVYAFLKEELREPGYTPWSSDDPRSPSVEEPATTVPSPSVEEPATTVPPACQGEPLHCREDGEGDGVTQTEEREVQTDFQTAETGINTDQVTGKYMEEVMSESQVLRERYQEVLDKQTQAEKQQQLKTRVLQEQREERLRVYQRTLEQVQELIGKRDENRRKFEKENKECSQKEQEMKNEIDRLEEEVKRLLRKQEEEEVRVELLIGEQTVERECWERELAELRSQLTEQNPRIEEETRRALNTEVAVLECQRENMLAQTEEWLTEAEQHLQNLRLGPGSIDNLQQRHEWDTQIGRVRIEMGNMQNQYNGHIQLVRNGAKLKSLPSIPVPSLPAVPMALPPPPVFRPPVPMAMPGGMPHYYMPPPALRQSAPPVSMVMPFTAPQHPPPAAAMPTQSIPTATVTSQTPAQPSGIPSPLPSNPQPASSKPAGKLEVLLEKLQSRFPQCTRPQLTSVLQQIKTSRGTMAGLSVEELTQQVAQTLAERQRQRQSLGPIGPPSTGTGPFPISVPQAYHPAPRMPSLPARQPTVPQSVNRKLCLMCQNVVEPGNLHPMSCSHTVHKECIKVWVQSSKNSGCPFCPSVK